MTKFEDQLFDDMMREHGPALERMNVPASRKRRAGRRNAMLAVGGVGLAGVAAVGGFLATSDGSGSPVYSVAKDANGSITLDVFSESGYAAANARLRQMGDKQVVVVPIQPGCPSVGSLPKPPVSGSGDDATVAIVGSSNGSVTVNATGIPAGAIMVIGLEIEGDSTHGVSILTSGSAPSCISGFAAPGSAGSASGTGNFGFGSASAGG
jgi:hypothetical protein